MLKMIKRLSFCMMITAMVCLLVQVAAILYLPHITAGIADHGVMTGNAAYVWSKASLMVGISVLCLATALLQMYLFSKIAYKLGNDLRADIYNSHC